MQLHELFSFLGKEMIRYQGDPETSVSSIAYDSRKVTEGSLFVCLRGALVDGHRYIGDAVKKGAAAILVCDEKTYTEESVRFPDCVFALVVNTRKALAIASSVFFGHPAEKLTVIGITGTKGKTSTSFMVRSILEHQGCTVGVIGTTGIFYAGKEEYIDNSTPESYELHRIFADMAASGITHVVMEVSSQALKMHRTYGINFDIGVFTNISPDHIGENEHEDFDEYLFCKSLLFRQCKKAVFNADAEHIDVIRNVIHEEKIPYVCYSQKDENSDLYAENVRFTAGEQLSATFTVKGLGELTVGTPGEFSVYNALCATSVALQCGASFDDAAAVLPNIHVFGRVEPVRHPLCKFAVIIDYAHNALSMESLYRSMKVYHPKNIYTVFGCGGNRSKLRRYDMGEIAGKYSTVSYITSDNPRHEKVEDIISDILVGMNRSGGVYTIIPDRRDAIRSALACAVEGDIVLIVGKGNQLYEEVGDEKIPFDEREVVKDYFDEIGSAASASYARFDAMLFPVVVTDKNSKTVYWNRQTDFIRPHRLGVHIGGLIADTDKEDYQKALQGGKCGVFSCMPSADVSHVAVFPRGNDLSVHFFIYNSLILNSLPDIDCFTRQEKLRRINDLIIRDYLDIICSTDDADTTAAHQILKINARRYHRMARHFLLYSQTVSNGAPIETLHNYRIRPLFEKLINDTKSILETSGGYITSEITDNDTICMLPKEDYFTVFLSALTIALRLSVDYSANIRINCADDTIGVSFVFRAVEHPDLEELYRYEFDFLRTVCRGNHWDITCTQVPGGNSVIDFSVPIIVSDTLTLSAGSPFDEKDDLHELISEELSVLF